MVSNLYSLYNSELLVILMIFFALPLPAQEIDFEKQDEQLIRDNPDLVIWHLKALRPQGKIFNVKAIDRDGNIHPVKAVQDSEDTQMLGVKAFINGEQLPIKLIVRQNDRYFPLKAITSDGELVDIKALTEDGTKLDVKGVSKSGNIVHIRAIQNDSIFYNLIAISPQGRTNIVKGIKMMQETVEMTINGVDIFAHVKAIPQRN